MAKFMLAIEGSNDTINEAIAMFRDVGLVESLSTPYIAPNATEQTAYGSMAVDDFKTIMQAAEKHLLPRPRKRLRAHSLENFKLCPRCQTLVFDKAKFCSNCSQALAEPSEEMTPKHLKTETASQKVKKDWSSKQQKIQAQSQGVTAGEYLAAASETDKAPVSSLIEMDGNKSHADKAQTELPPPEPEQV